LESRVKPNDAISCAVGLFGKFDGNAVITPALFTVGLAVGWDCWHARWIAFFLAAVNGFGAFLTAALTQVS
jgi:hypothetical protein